MGAMAYWISPTGKIIDAEISHINYVFKNPEKFNLTRKYIEKVYKKTNEPIGWDGFAKDNLVREILKLGWIRARYYDKGGWTIQAQNLNKKTKDNIWDFVEMLFSKNKIGRYTDIKIDDISKGASIASSGEEVLKGQFYEAKQFKNEKKKIDEAMKRFRKSIRLSDIAKKAQK